MRRIVSFLLAAALALGLTGCAGAPTWEEQYDLGVRYLSEGNYEEAVIAFTAAIEIDPRRAEAYVGRGDAYLASGETEENLKAALADYEAALDLDGRQEEVYEKLSAVYLAMGETERGLEILEEGAEELDSDRMRREAERQRAAALSDEALLALANENVMTVYNLEYGISAGAWFEQEWDDYVEGEHGELWFLVTDERARTMADVEAYWGRYFSSSMPLPEDILYQEIDGRLYSGNMGIGGDVTLLEYRLTDVQSRSETSAVLTGYALRRDWGAAGEEEVPYQFRYEMELEDGTWKCAGFQEGDRVYDVVPDEEEQRSPLFDDTFWLWKLSPGNGGSFYARFYRDGTFTYLRPTDLYGSIGTYEYDGERLYLNGIEYESDGTSFAAPEGRDVMGGLDWHYTLEPDPSRRYLELETQRGQ